MFTRLLSLFKKSKVLDDNDFNEWMYLQLSKLEGNYDISKRIAIYTKFFEEDILKSKIKNWASLEDNTKDRIEFHISVFIEDLQVQGEYKKCIEFYKTHKEFLRHNTYVNSAVHSMLYCYLYEKQYELAKEYLDEFYRLNQKKYNSYEEFVEVKKLTFIADNLLNSSMNLPRNKNEY